MTVAEDELAGVCIKGVVFGSGGVKSDGLLREDLGEEGSGLRANGEV